ncbi:hypothetical protein COCNU_scaffold004059G000010 [Cocos nucifera]|nr:hypothetical protein [Cocos nucifera]
MMLMPLHLPSRGSCGEEEKKERNAIAKKVKRKAEAFRALQEAQAEIEKVQAEIDCLMVASVVQTIEVDYLREALWRKEEASIGLNVALTLSEDKRKKVEEEVGIEKERAVEDFMSSKAMEDIKVAFAREIFL